MKPESGRTGDQITRCNGDRSRVGTGEILALANYPTFDPNSIEGKRSRERGARSDARRIARSLTTMSRFSFQDRYILRGARRGLDHSQSKVSADGGSIQLFGRTIEIMYPEF
jgi:hypothetical protein